MNAADRILEALRATGPDAYRGDPDHLDVWWAYCPACGARAANERRLRVVELSALSVDLTCSAGCDRPAILRALHHAEQDYPNSWRDSSEHPCPAYDAAAAEAVLEQLRRERRQHDAEDRIRGAA